MPSVPVYRLLSRPFWPARCWPLRWRSPRSSSSASTAAATWRIGPSAGLSGRSDLVAAASALALAGTSSRDPSAAPGADRGLAGRRLTGRSRGCSSGRSRSSEARASAARRRRWLTGLAIVAVVTTLAFLHDPAAGALRAFARSGLRSLVISGAFASTGSWVFRARRRAGEVGPGLVATACGLFSLHHLHFFALSLFELRGAGAPSYSPYLGLVELVRASLLGLAMVTWLLEEEQGGRRRRHARSISSPTSTCSPVCPTASRSCSAWTRRSSGPRPAGKASVWSSWTSTGSRTSTTAEPRGGRRGAAGGGRAPAPQRADWRLRGATRGRRVRRRALAGRLARGSRGEGRDLVGIFASRFPFAGRDL